MARSRNARIVTHRSGNSGSLGRYLDREIYACIRTYLDDLEDRQQLDTADISVSSIYQHIKRSNSSLARKSKSALEDSIERILESFKDDLDESSGSGSETVAEEAALAAAAEAPTSMNRRLVQQWNATAGTAKSASSSSPKMSKAGNADETNAGMKRPASNQSLKVNDSHQNKKRIIPRPEDSNSAIVAPRDLSFDDFGGMLEVIERLTELVLLPLRYTEHFTQSGSQMPHGILLHGPPGCGKTKLCETIAAETGVPFLPISAPSVVSGMSGESEKAIRELFKQAVENAPSIIFIDEIDAIAPKRENAQREMERRLVAQLVTCMDDLDLRKTNGKPVILLAATNRPDSLDPALRRGGRLDTEIAIGVPDLKTRTRILEVQTRNIKLDDDVSLEDLARKMPGYVGADLQSLVNTASSESNKSFLKVLHSLSQQHAPQDEQNMMPQEGDTAVELTTSIIRWRALFHYSYQPQPAIPSSAITQADFLAALPKVQPTALREGFASVPKTSFADIGALVAHRHALTNAIINPLKYPERYAKFGLTHPQGVLLYGPPGCGKTMLARAVARESGANFISVKGPEMMDKYVGESEKALRTLFSRARHSQPVIIFFDELDALTPRRGGGEASAETGGSAISEASNRVVNTLLAELDSADRSAPNTVHVIAATNRPESIDPAILRSGRLGKHLFVGLPSASERSDIMATILKSMPMNAEEKDRAVAWAGVDRECRGMSGADLENLCREAAQVAVEREGDVLVLGDLMEGVRRGIKASVGAEECRRWERVRLG